VDLGSLGVSAPTRLGPVALFHVEHSWQIRIPRWPANPR
jgi:hypothetical protein